MLQILISVGIDIGTSTTQLIFSRLTVENLASDYTVPHISIIQKEILYKSGIYFTPLLSGSEIDSEKVKEIVSGEYEKAGIRPEQVSSGAVIITGETARKHNAEKVLDTISEFAGNFVVTTAGPALESVLSGRGAGADKISGERGLCLVNIDVGGGTSNFSVFNKGEVSAATCMDIGGRLVKIDKRTRKITYISPKIKKLADAAGIPISEGETADEAKLSRLCRRMADILFAAVGEGEKPPFYEELFTAGCSPLLLETPFFGISFSGGVADFIYGTEADTYQYGDIGVLLGREIKRRCETEKLRLFRSRETIRATVIGAGLHTVELSGSTIFYTGSISTIKNAAVLKVPEEKLTDAEEFIRQRLRFYSADEMPDVAIAFSGKDFTSFEQIQTLSRQIVNGAQTVMKSNRPLIVVVEQDVAKALGQAINRRLHHTKDMICLDGIKTMDGDYIDIGKPVADGSAVPVVVKTLIFNT